MEQSRLHSENAVDLALVARIVAGDRDALATLYDRHATRLYHLGRRLLGDELEAEDLLHDVFLEAWRTAATYQPARGTVRAWLAVRMRSRALDRLKSARVRSARSDHDVETLASTDAPQSIDVARLRRALDELAHGHRDLLELAFVGGFTMQELAARLGIPVGTVKSRVAAGLSSMRRSFRNAQAA